MVKEGGAKVTLDNLGGSPLHNAVELGHYEVNIYFYMKYYFNVKISPNNHIMNVRWFYTPPIEALNFTPVCSVRAGLL